MGVDILDPVQVAARDMEISGLKRRFGRDICFHGGVDAQKMLTQGTPEEIRKEVRRINSIFDGEGGIILGPSHYITADTPAENILAMYKDM
jgi:uroporphyrinogen decarboxylase